MNVILFSDAKDLNVVLFRAEIVSNLNMKVLHVLVFSTLIFLTSELKSIMDKEELGVWNSLSPEERLDRLAKIKQNGKDAAETEKAVSGLWKCPNPFCRAPYMKTGGCRHIKCLSCNMDFNEGRASGTIQELELMR
jgi:hypothetical protein